MFCIASEVPNRSDPPWRSAWHPLELASLLFLAHLQDKLLGLQPLRQGLLLEPSKTPPSCPSHSHAIYLNSAPKEPQNLSSNHLPTYKASCFTALVTAQTPGPAFILSPCPCARHPGQAIFLKTTLSSTQPHSCLNTSWVPTRLKINQITQPVI